MNGIMFKPLLPRKLKNMALPQNFKRIKIIFSIFSIILLFSLITCKQYQSAKGSIGYGKMYYYDNCLACHSQKSSGDEISLDVMSNYDSSSLLMRLKNLKENQIHKNHLINVRYSDEEVNSLFIFINSYKFPIVN